MKTRLDDDLMTMTQEIFLKGVNEVNKYSYRTVWNAIGQIYFLISPLYYEPLGNLCTVS